MKLWLVMLSISTPLIWPALPNQDSLQLIFHGDFYDAQMNLPKNPSPILVLWLGVLKGQKVKAKDIYLFIHHK